VVSRKVEFGNRQAEDALRGLTPVGIVAGSGHCFYYFGSRKGEEVNVAKLKGTEENPNKG
jgi:hypothetical protein